MRVSVHAKCFYIITSLIFVTEQVVFVTSQSNSQSFIKKCSRAVIGMSKLGGGKQQAGVLREALYGWSSGKCPQERSRLMILLLQADHMPLQIIMMELFLWKDSLILHCFISFFSFYSLTGHHHHWENGSLLKWNVSLFNSVFMQK